MSRPRRDTIESGDRVWYVGPQESDLCRGRPPGVDGEPERQIGSTGKARAFERGAVYVSWGGGEEGWLPRSYVMTGKEWLRRQGASSFQEAAAWV